MVSSMDLKELYMSIDDTLTDDTVKKLVDIYSNYNGNIYNGLTYHHSKSIPYNNNHYINGKERDYFYSFCFNTWKRNVCTMTFDEFKKLEARGSYKRDFVNLRNYLLHVPDISSYEEMRELYYGDNTPKDIKDLFEKYSWDSLGAYSGWEHVDSRYLHAKRTNRLNVEHRLYINTDAISLYPILNLFVKKCSEKNIPFYFKFDMDSGFRDDTIPIYSDSEHLIDYIDILQDIKRNNPDLKFYEPPLLSGKIDGFIGYGSEPDERITKKRTSFNDLRADIIGESITRCRNNWIKSNLNTNFGTNERPRTITQIIVRKAVIDFVEGLINTYNRYIDNEKKRRSAHNYTDNKSIEEVVFEKLQYTPQMIDNTNFKNKVYQSIYNDVDNYIRSDFTKEIRIPININGKDTYYSNYDMKKTLCSFTSSIMKNDSNFIDSIKKDIRDNCKQFGIIPDKFCCDITRVNSMISTYKSRKMANNEYVALSDEDIKEARRKIGIYEPPKRRFTKEEMLKMISEDNGNGRKNDKRI